MEVVTSIQIISSHSYDLRSLVTQPLVRLKRGYSADLTKPNNLFVTLNRETAVAGSVYLNTGNQK